jgi:very-short-patch-repair endonuclease
MHVLSLNWTEHSIFADQEAYRRDRRKDALLQQNGYFVLRFLAEDLGKRLDYVLDTVLGALIHRQGRPRSFVCV